MGRIVEVHLDESGLSDREGLLKHIAALEVNLHSLVVVLPQRLNDQQHGLFDILGVIESDCPLHLVIETDGLGFRGSGQVADGFAGVLDLRESLIGCTDVTPVHVGVRVSPFMIPMLWDVVEAAQVRKTLLMFMVAGCKDQFSATERYQLVEFLEGFVNSGVAGRPARQVYESMIESLLSASPSLAVQTSTPECIRYQLVNRILVQCPPAAPSGAFEEDSPACWADFFRPWGGASSGLAGPHKAAPVSRQLRSLVLRSATRLGLEALVRRLGGLFLAPYRRAVSRRKFSQRLECLADDSDDVGAWPEAGGGSKVLICGWYGTETLGDKAILAGIVESLKASLDQPRFALVSLHSYISEMTRSQMQELAGMKIVTPAQGVSLAKSADLVVFGGGPLMALGVLAEMQVIFQVAKAHAAKTLIAGCGVGPLGHDWHNQSIRRILELSDLRIFRDQRSRELAADLGVDVQADVVAEDPAFSWLLSLESPPTKQAPKESQVLLLGLRDFPYRAYARHLDEAACLAAKRRYEQAVVDAMTVLVDRNPQLIVRPLPMCTNHFGGDDRWFYRDLFRQHSKIQGRLDTTLLGMELAPVEYCQAFREAQVGLVMRFHSLVFALGLDLPAVAIDYTLGHGKVNALAARFGVPQRSLDQLDADFLVTELQALLDAPIPQRADWMPEFNSVVRSKVPALLDSRG